MRYGLLLIALLAAGCGTAAGPFRDGSDAVNVFPANYKADLLAFLRTYLNDPTNVRDAAVTEPALRSIGPDTRYVVCLRYNARDSVGRYTGTRDRLALFHRGRFDRLLESAREKCRDAAYMPFPELERLTR